MAFSFSCPVGLLRSLPSSYPSLIHFFLREGITKRSYSFDERQHTLSVLTGAETNPELSHLTESQRVRLAAGVSHPPGPSTIRRWKVEGLSREDFHANLHRRGRPSTLSADQQLLLCGYACFRRQKREAVTGQHLVDFSSTHFNTSFSKPRISQMMKEWGFSSQLAMKRESRMTTQKVVDDSIAFLETVRGYGYPPDRIITMDETGLWSNVVAPRTYSFRNGLVFPSFPQPLIFRFSLNHSLFLSLLPLAHDSLPVFLFVLTT